MDYTAIAVASVISSSLAATAVKVFGSGQKKMCKEAFDVLFKKTRELDISSHSDKAASKEFRLALEKELHEIKTMLGTIYAQLITRSQNV